MNVTPPQDWLDKAMIRDLCFAYAEACDRKDAEALASCFAQNMELIAPGFTGSGASLAGQITGILEQMFDRTQHKVFNTRHHVDGDQSGWRDLLHRLSHF